VSGQQHALAVIYPRKRSGTHFTEGWVGPRAGLDGRKISSPTGIRSRTVQPVAQSLYRLSYRAHRLNEVQILNLLYLFIKYRPFIVWRGNESTCDVIKLIRLRTETGSTDCFITVLDNVREARIRDVGLLTKRKYDKMDCVCRFNYMPS